MRYDIEKQIEMKFDEWRGKNSEAITNDARKSGTVKTIHTPEIIKFEGKSYKGINGDNMKMWIHRKTDTSIKPDMKGYFKSEGTSIEILDSEAIVNTQTSDIFINDGGIKLLGTSHHTKGCLEWIYWKNNVDLNKYRKQIEVSERKQKKAKVNWSKLR